MQSILLNAGKSALARAIAEGRKLKVVAFRIGQAANFTPVVNGINPSPTIIYSGDASAVKSSLINEDEIRYTVTLIEPIGSFNVGNIMLFLGDEKQPGVLIPYLHGVLPVPLPKYKQQGTTTIGNRLDINITAKYTNVSEAFTLNVTPSSLSSLPNYRDEFDLPIPSQAVHQQVVLQNTTPTGAPSIIVRREIDDSYYALTFFQRLDDPNFGGLAGGVAGDNYAPFFGEYIAGGLFKYPPSAFNLKADGGDSWGVPLENDYPIDGGNF